MIFVFMMCVLSGAAFVSVFVLLGLMLMDGVVRKKQEK